MQEQLPVAGWKTGITAAAALLLGGCLAGEPSDESPDTSLVLEKQLTGSVGDGPVVNANMRVMTRGGDQIAEFRSDMQGGYNITVNARESQFPLVIDATGGTDLVTNLAPDFVLRGAAWSSSSRITANVNPFSTIAFEIARDLDGGFTSSNFRDAQDIVVSALNGGLTSLRTAGPMTATIDEDNVAEIVKASETVGETIRRTRDAIEIAGFAVNADGIVQALGSDLIDGVIESNGGSRADARVSAVTTIAYAQALLESMANELYVNGVPATDAIRTAIVDVSPGTPSPTLEELTITAEMIASAQIGVSAAYEVTGDPAIEQLGQAIAGLQPGMTAELVRNLLPDDYRTRLNAALAQVAAGNSTTLTTVNDIARDGDSTIDPPNRAPIISGTPAASVAAGSAYTFTPSASDPDGDTMTFSITGRPTWATFDANTGRLAGTPTAGDVGSYMDITIEVTDGELTDTLSPFTINVFEGNQPPTISGNGAATLDIGEPYSFTPSAIDPENDTLTFSAMNAPAWTTLDPADGTLSGTPAAGDVGTYSNIRIRVSDGEFTASTPSFTITVLADNQAPTISGTPPSQAREGQAYSFLPSASDPDGDTLTFSITNQPGWAGFNPSTGRLSGTPGSSDVGEHGEITITVSDGELTDSIGPFSITVDAANNAPTISGSPPGEVTAGNAYTFTPTANDPDNDTLSYTVAGLPSWASFDNGNGRITGTPRSGDVGVYSNISITVSDGSLSDTLGPFSIEVVAQGASTGSVTLEWVAPTENVDGTDLTDLAGFKIYWGTQSGNYPNSVTIDNPGITTHVVENLTPGTYIFVATAYDAEGTESDFSSELTRYVR